MKTTKYQPRFYRGWVKAKDLYSTDIVLKETDLQILTDKHLDNNFVIERIKSYRYEIENYINKDKRFLSSLRPIPVEVNAPLIIREMGNAAWRANVGPMAAVAGAVAQSLGKDLLKKGYKQVIVENGGDIFLKSTRVRAIAIYAGKSNRWNRLKLKIRPKDTPIGIATSSGTIGHSLSFGLADSVVILSNNAALADSVATAAGNLVKSKQDLAKAIDFARSIKGISGAVIILGKELATWGRIELEPS